jgi:transcription initiation factor IIF auxiliary subunit
VGNISKINATAKIMDASKVPNKLRLNPQFKPVSGINTMENYSVALSHEAKKIDNNTYFAKISLVASNETLLNIKKVVYYLHPTFTPSVITAESLKDKFAISFTGWGFFNLKAKVYFKDGKIQDLSIPIDEWNLTL